MLLLPLKLRALPIFPVVQAGPFTRVPVLFLPDESTAVLPAPSSSFQYPIRLGSLPLAPTVTRLLAASEVYPLSSKCRNSYVPVADGALTENVPLVAPLV